MSKKKFLDEVYDLDTVDLTRDLYDDWADTYDEEVTGEGYITPTRVAEALASVTTPGERTLPLLDFGCGTGLSGVALKNAGFSNIHGRDLSPEMLAKAGQLGVYQDLQEVGADLPGSELFLLFPLITAVGVISAGAAPASVLPGIFNVMAQGAKLAFSYNSHTLDDPEYMDTLAKVLDDEHAVLEFSEHGEHLPGRGMTSRVMVIRRE